MGISGIRMERFMAARFPAYAGNPGGISDGARDGRFGHRRLVPAPIGGAAA